MNQISFNESPAIGAVVYLDDQVYELRGSEPYTRKDGAVSALLTWETACPSCGETFRVKTGLSAGAINRRCANCAKPFKPVKGKRSRKVRVTGGRS